MPWQYTVRPQHKRRALQRTRGQRGTQKAEGVYWECYCTECCYRNAKRWRIRKKPFIHCNYEIVDPWDPCYQLDICLCLPTASALPYPYRILVTAPQSFTTFLVIEEVSVSYHISLYHTDTHSLLQYWPCPSYARSLRSIEISKIPKSSQVSRPFWQ